MCLACTVGGDTDYSSSDVRWRIQQDSYVQDQYVLTCCSLSSERTFSSPSHQAASSVLGMGSLPHGLEKIEPPQGRGLSRWESPWAQNATCLGETASGKVKTVWHWHILTKCFIPNSVQYHLKNSQTRLNYLWKQSQQYYYASHAVQLLYFINCIIHIIINFIIFST